MDIRNVNFGMSQDEVINNEHAKLVHSENEILVYETSVMGLNTILGYKFNHNQLALAMYSFNDLDGLGVLREQLSKKYGEPHIEINWKNPLLEGSIEFSQAVLLGLCTIYLTWNNGKIKVEMIIEKEENNLIPQLKLAYSSSILVFEEEIDTFGL